MRKISSDDLLFYERNGYLVVEDVVSPASADELRQRVEEVATGQAPLPEECFQVIDPARSPGVSGRGDAFGLQVPSRHDELFRAFTTLPEVRALAQDLLGPDIELYTDQVIRKPAGCGGSTGAATQFHQDDYYWHCTSRTINFWFALDDAGESSGGLRFIPESHKQGLLEHVGYWDEPQLVSMVSGKAFQRWGLPPEAVDMKLAVSAPVKQGGCVCFSTHTFHASWPNAGQDYQRAYAIAFSAAESA